MKREKDLRLSWRAALLFIIVVFSLLLSPLLITQMYEGQNAVTRPAMTIPAMVTPTVGPTTESAETSGDLGRCDSLQLANHSVVERCVSQTLLRMTARSAEIDFQSALDEYHTGSTDLQETLESVLALHQSPSIVSGTNDPSTGFENVRTQWRDVQGRLTEMDQTAARLRESIVKLYSARREIVSTMNQPGKLQSLSESLAIRQSAVLNDLDFARTQLAALQNAIDLLLDSMIEIEINVSASGQAEAIFRLGQTIEAEVDKTSSSLQQLEQSVQAAVDS